MRQIPPDLNTLAHGLDANNLNDLAKLISVLKTGSSSEEFDQITNRLRKRMENTKR